MISLQKHKGFTLVELVIVISIIGVLLMAGSSLTSAWVDGSKVNNASSAFKNAIFQARIAALRNTNNKDSNQPAASVCVEDGSIKVVIVGSNASLVCESVTSSLAQNITISKGISITQGNSTVKCLTFSPAGLLLSFSGCTSNANDVFTIKKNGEKSEINII